MASFVNPDPFNQERKADHGNSGDSTETSGPAPPSIDANLGGIPSCTLEAQSSTRSDHSDSGEHGHHHTIDKLAGAFDHLQSGVTEKAKAAKHMFHLESIHTASVSRFVNPTVLRIRVQYDSAWDANSATELLWRARDNRKGRNSIAFLRLPDDSGDFVLPNRFTPRMKANAREIAYTFRRMFTTFPYWDMAFWSGWSYTVGSALFVVSGVLAWGPIAYGESFEVPKAESHGGPLAFFFGALFYQAGAVTAYLEAVNDGSFHGSAMRRLLEGHEGDSKKLLDEKIQDFLHRLSPHRPHRGSDERAIDEMLVDPEAGWNTKELRDLRPGSVYPRGKSPAPRRGGVDLGGEEGHPSIYETWRWWPTRHALRTHHVYDIGWQACTIQLFGVTMYAITGVVNLPGVLSSLNDWQQLVAFWIPQVVAALCFLVASLMFMLETQERWWKLEPLVLGWWVGVWATIGSIGFELIAIFGILDISGRSWAAYQSSLTTIWASAAYFTSSALQWYEAINKNPIEELFSGSSEKDRCPQRAP